MGRLPALELARVSGDAEGSRIVAELALNTRSDLKSDRPARKPSCAIRAFVSATTINGLIKQPIEYLVGMLRLLGLTTAAFGEGTIVCLLGNPRPAAFRSLQRRRMGPEPVLAVDFGEQLPARPRLGCCPIRRPDTGRGPKRQPRRPGGRDLEDARHRLLVEWDLRRTLEDGRQGEHPQELLVMALVSPEFLMN